MHSVRTRERKAWSLTALCSGLASAAALTLLSAPAHAGEECSNVVISFSEPTYRPTDPVELTICGEPGLLLGLMLDRVGGPVYIPGWGNFEVAGSSSFVIVPLPPMPEEGCMTISCSFPCGSALLDVPIYTQVLSYDIGTEEFCLSNGAMLLIENDAELCSQALQGCTPGFWRNHADASMWAATGLDKKMLFNDVFGVPDFPGLTLIDALKPPGQMKTFEAHSVAALLNAMHPPTNYGMGYATVISCVRDELAEDPSWENLEPLKDIFKDYNEMGCPW